MSVWEDQIVLPLASRTADATSSVFRAHGATGLYVGLHIKAFGAGTFTLQLLGKEPFEANTYQLNVDLAVAATSNNRHHYYFYPGVAMQPDGEGADTTATIVRQVVGIPIPDQFLIKVVQSSATPLEYGVWIRRLP